MNFVMRIFALIALSVILYNDCFGMFRRGLTGFGGIGSAHTVYDNEKNKENCKKIDPNTKELACPRIASVLENALEMAIREGNALIVNGLLELGANPNISNQSAYFYPLHQAIKGTLNPNPEIVRLLLKYGADPNVRCLNNNTILHDLAQTAGIMLVDKSIEQIVSALLSFGADPKLRNNKGKIPYDVMKEMQSCTWVRLNIHILELLKPKDDYAPRGDE